MAHALGNVEVGTRGTRRSLAGPNRIRKLFWRSVSIWKFPAGGPHMTRWVRRISYAFLSLLGLGLVVGFTYEQIGRARDVGQ